MLLGTVFPLISEALSKERVTVGAPYFERMTMPIGLTLLFLMAIAPVLPWRKASAETLRTRLLWPGWIGTGVLALSVVLGAHGFAPLLAFFLAGFAGGSALRQLVLATRRQGWRGLVGRTNGGMVVHLGVLMIGVAFAASSSFSTERNARLCVEAQPGCPSSITVAGHRLTYLGKTTNVNAVRRQVGARFEDHDRVFEPAIQQFANGNQQIGKPTVSNSPTSSVLVSLTDLPTEGGGATVKVIVQPMIVWLWIGGGVMAIGSVMAAFPGRRRPPADAVWPAHACARGSGAVSRRSHPARLATAVVGVIVLLLVALLATREPAGERKTSSALVGRQAPAGITGEVILGQPFDLGATDRWVLVNFFATWCVPSSRTFPELPRLPGRARQGRRRPDRQRRLLRQAGRREEVLRRQRRRLDGVRLRQRPHHARLGRGPGAGVLPGLADRDRRGPVRQRRHPGGARPGHGRSHR